MQRTAGTRRAIAGGRPATGGRRARMGGRAISWTLKNVRCFFFVLAREGLLTPPPRLLQPWSLGRPSFPIPPLPLLPRPHPLPPLRSDLSERSRSRISSSLCLRSRSVSARVSPSLARRISSFFSSTKLCGMPGKSVLQLVSSKGRP